MTELIWDGKYTDDPKSGKRLKTAPVRVALPFQTIETVNESAADRDRTASLFASGRETEWRNRLIWGDKKYVLPSLLSEFAGKVDLIYIDPPFDTGANFSFTRTIPDSDETFTKEPSVIEQKAYRDTWGKGLDSYLKWFYETAVLLRELLSETGSIYVHLDYNVGHYAKVIMDEIFGLENFKNCIVWKRGPGKSHPRGYGHNTDYILFYTKSLEFKWTKQYGEMSEEYTESFKEDEHGKYVTTPLHSGKPPKVVPEWRGIKPPSGRGWAYKIDTLEEFDKQGRIEWSSGGIPRLKRYLSEIEGTVIQELWVDIKPILAKSNNHLGYATQKPDDLLERVIKASSDEGDLVLDCFCGSGTTAAVAERLGRRWITCDLGRFAIHTARKRLLGVAAVKPFVVQNLGKYERQAWQVAEFGGKEQAVARERAYREFLLALFKARAIESGVWLHGVKNGRMVHVGGVDAPVSAGDITQVAIEFKKRMGTGADAPTETGVDILGWDFAFELNEVGKQTAANAGINARFYKIPREVLEKKAVEQGDIRFFELAALSVDVKQTKRSVTLALTDFVIPIDDVPEDVQRAIKHWAQWVDYWAVDWDYKGDTFHNQWQNYRTKKSPDLQKLVVNTYAEPGTYVILVKVIDILGNDTTKTVTVEVT